MNLSGWTHSVCHYGFGDWTDFRSYCQGLNWEVLWLRGGQGFRDRIREGSNLYVFSRNKGLV